MRRPTAILLSLTLALGGWIVAGAIHATPYRATAQSPAVEINRVQDADFLPRASRRPIFILAIGSDARPDEPVDGRLADGLQLVAVNPRKGAGTIVGIPRDSYVEIPGVGQRKVNDALFYGGPELVVQAVQNLTGIAIDYYVLTGFTGLEGLVKGIGGIEVEVPYDMADAASGAYFDQGRRKLNGAEALAFTRNRKDTPNGDFSRSENQGTLLLAALEKLRDSYEEDPAVIFEWIAVGLRHVQTDLSFDEVFDLMLTAVQIDPSKMERLVAPGGIGSAGEASVVILGDEARAIFADVGDDGLLSSSG